MLRELNVKLIALPSGLKYSMAVLGWALLAAAFLATGPLAAWYKAPTHSENAQVSLSHYPYIPPLLIMTKEIGHLRIAYDEEINIADFGEVTFHLELPIFHGLEAEEVKPLRLELTGPAIDVSPEGEKEFSPQQLLAEEDITWTWTYRSSEPGSNQLSLVVDNLPYDQWYKARINSEPYQIESPIQLPVKVVSLSGLSPRIEFFIKTSAAVVAFVFTYPLIVSRLRSSDGATEEDQPSSGPAARERPTASGKDQVKAQETPRDGA